MLQSNTSLERLWLGDNNLSDEGVCAIAAGLHDNLTLVWLDVSSNSVGDGGMRALALLLRNKSTLQVLDVHDNRVTDEGAKFLARDLSPESRLHTLNMSANLLTNGGARAWLYTLTGDVQLKTLGLDHNLIGYDLHEKVKAQLKKNDEKRSAGRLSESTTRPPAASISPSSVQCADSTKVLKQGAENTSSKIQLSSVDYKTKLLLLSEVAVNDPDSEHSHPYTIASLDEWIETPLAADMHKDEILMLLRDSRVIEQELMRWLSATAQLEANEEYDPTSADVSLLQCISRLYHKLVPLQKKAAAIEAFTKRPASVFIAHSGFDKDTYASPIHGYLKRHGVSSFLDRKSLPTGGDGDRLMMEAACSCRYMWCVLSKNFLRSGHAMRELMIGYVRHMTEGRDSFCLLLDCLELQETRGKWMNQVLDEMRTLKLYKTTGEEHMFPTNMKRALPDEDVVERLTRIAADQLADGNVLVPDEGTLPPVLKGSKFLGQSVEQYQTARRETDIRVLRERLDDLITQLMCLQEAARAIPIHVDSVVNEERRQDQSTTRVVRATCRTESFTDGSSISRMSVETHLVQSQHTPSLRGRLDDDDYDVSSVVSSITGVAPPVPLREETIESSSQHGSRWPSSKFNRQKNKKKRTKLGNIPFFVWFSKEPKKT